MSALTKTLTSTSSSSSSSSSSVEVIPSCVAANAASRGLLMPDGFAVEGSILPEPIESFAAAVSNTAHTIGSIPSMIFSVPRQLRGEKVDTGYVCPQTQPQPKPKSRTSPRPRLRSWRSVLNRQQALRNSCAAQAEHLDPAGLLARLYLQILLTISWAWTASRSDFTLYWSGTTARHSAVDVPVAAFKGEPVMAARGNTVAGEWSSLGRVQCLIDRGQSAISHREIGVQEEQERENDDLCALFAPDGVVQESKSSREAAEARTRVAFASEQSWLVASISWEFAVFYMSVLSARLGLSLMSATKAWE